MQISSIKVHSWFCKQQLIPLQIISLQDVFVDKEFPKLQKKKKKSAEHLQHISVTAGQTDENHVTRSKVAEQLGNRWWAHFVLHYSFLLLHISNSDVLLPNKSDDVHI